MVHSKILSGGRLSVHTFQRRMATLLPGARPVVGGGTLEVTSPAHDEPTVRSATVIEHTSMTAHAVGGAATVGFGGFLDGTQRSEVSHYIGFAPIVIGHVAAVIRTRTDGRMRTWRAPLIEDRVYVPRRFVPASMWDTMKEECGDLLVDTLDGNSAANSHPYALRDVAISRVQTHRDQLEQQLGNDWCASERDTLFLDGGISGSETVALSRKTIGVIKTHRRLYAEGDDLLVVLALRHRERSSVFRVPSATRTEVASWYLRLRDPEGHDPTWGLVRVEAALPDAAVEEISTRADEVSRWILAEVTPLALPDARWDKMVYGIRDCEEYLRAVTQ